MSKKLDHLGARIDVVAAEMKSTQGQISSLANAVGRRHAPPSPQSSSRGSVAIEQPESGSTDATEVAAGLSSISSAVGTTSSPSPNVPKSAISDNASVRVVHVETTMSIGPLNALLAENKIVGDGCRSLTDLTPNNWTLAMKSRRLMRAVASPSQLLIWARAEREGNVSAIGTDPSFRSIAFDLERLVKARFDEREQFVFGAVSKSRSLTMNSMSARLTALNKKDATVDAFLQAQPSTAPPSFASESVVEAKGSAQVRSKEAAAVAEASAKATAVRHLDRPPGASSKRAASELTVCEKEKGKKGETEKKKKKKKGEKEISVFFPPPPRPLEQEQSKGTL